VIGAARDLVHLGSIGLRLPRGRVDDNPSSSPSPADGSRPVRPSATLLSPRTLAPKSSLNADIGTKRAIDFVRLDLEEIRTVAHAHGATINDLLLTLVAGGLGETIGEARRGDVFE